MFFPSLYPYAVGFFPNKNMWVFFPSNFSNFLLKTKTQPWPAWLSWLRVILQSQRLLLGFPGSKHAWSVCLVPIWGACKRQPINIFFVTSMFLSLCFFLTLPLSKINKYIFFKNEDTNTHFTESLRRLRIINITVFHLHILSQWTVFRGNNRSELAISCDNNSFF